MLRHLKLPTVVTVVCPAILLFATVASAAEPVNVSASMLAEALAEGTVESPGLGPIDWFIIAVYATSTITLGWYYSRKQRSTAEYFVGQGNMNPLLVGVSLFATLLSTISYLSMPGEALGKGPVTMTTMLALPLLFLIVGYWLIPIYMRQRVTSAYELLENRLGLGVRLLGAMMFITMRLVWMSLLMYVAAKAMTVMLGVDDEWIPMIVFLTGSVAVIYTSLGGLQAVVITDLLQTLLLFGGALLVLGMITIDFGGFGWFPTTWHANWDTQPIFSFDPQTRVTVVGSIFSMLTWYVCTAGGDQVSVQRFMATADAGAARRAYATQLSVGAVVGVTLGLVGFALLSYFEVHADALPAGMSLKENADDLFPRFISFHLPAGVSGLVVAAMFAAAMSSVDSGVNSITAVVMTDFLDRCGKRPATEKGHVRTAQLLALCIGGIVVVGSSFMKHIHGNFTEVTQKTTNLLVTPLFALFIFALFVPFSRPAGVLVGAFFGTATALVIGFSGPIVAVLAVDYGVDPAAFGVELITKIDPNTGLTTTTAPDPISFQWIGPIALSVNLLTGTLASLLITARSRDHAEN